MDDSTSLDESTAASVKNEILWKYYTDRVPNREALCKTCDKIVLCRGSAVSLTNHLKYAHNIVIDDIYKELKQEIKEDDFLTDHIETKTSSPVPEYAETDDMVMKTLGTLLPIPLNELATQPLNASAELVINSTLFQEKPQVEGSKVNDTNGQGTTNEWLNDAMPSTYQEAAITKSTYSCEKCNFQTLYEYDLTIHERTVHQNEENFSCNICDYSTSSKGNFKQHVKTVHDFVSDFSCSLCYFHTSKGYDLDIHMERMHNNAMVSKKRQKPEPDELTNVPKVTITHSAAPRNDKLASELDQCIEQELSVRPKRRKPFVPPTDGWKRCMDSDPPKPAEDESSEKGKKKESDGWKRFM